jgi:hypothetical protein
VIRLNAGMADRQEPLGFACCCNTRCPSSAAVAARPTLNITLHVRWLSCLLRKHVLWLGASKQTTYVINVPCYALLDLLLQSLFRIIFRTVEFILQTVVACMYSTCRNVSGVQVLWSDLRSRPILKTIGHCKWRFRTCVEFLTSSLFITRCIV